MAEVSLIVLTSVSLLSVPFFGKATLLTRSPSDEEDVVGVAPILALREAFSALASISLVFFSSALPSRITVSRTEANSCRNLCSGNLMASYLLHLGPRGGDGVVGASTHSPPNMMSSDLIKERKRLSTTATEEWKITHNTKTKDAGRTFVRE